MTLFTCQAEVTCIYTLCMYVITTLSILLVVSIYQYSLPQPSIQAIEKQDEQFG